MKGVNKRSAASVVQLCRKHCPDVAAKRIFQHLRKGSETLTPLAGVLLLQHMKAPTQSQESPATAYLALLRKTTFNVLCYNHEHIKKQESVLLRTRSNQQDESLIIIRQKCKNYYRLIHETA